MCAGDYYAEFAADRAALDAVEIADWRARADRLAGMKPSEIAQTLRPSDPTTNGPAGHIGYRWIIARGD